MNLIKIAFFTLLSIMIIFFTLKIGGLSSNYTPYDHPLLKAPQPWIIAEIPEDLEKIDQLIIEQSSRKNLWLSIEVRINRDETFYAASTSFLKYHSLPNLLKLTNSEIEQKNSIVKLQKVEDLLLKYSKQNFLLYVKDDQKEIDLRLQALLTKTKASDRVLLGSEYDNVLSSLKELNPLGLYSTGSGEKTKMLMMSGLYIESVSGLKGDVWITPLYFGKAPLLNPHLRAELKRRFIPLIIGPINDEKEFLEAKNFTPNGYIFAKPELLNLIGK